VFVVWITARASLPVWRSSSHSGYSPKNRTFGILAGGSLAFSIFFILPLFGGLLNTDEDDEDEDEDDEDVDDEDVDVDEEEEDDELFSVFLFLRFIFS